MQNMDINLAITADTLIAIISIAVTVLIAIIGGIYAIITNTKKYELTENFRKELLEWYSSVINLMIRIIHFSETGEFFCAEFSAQKTEMLSQLSALTEVGRFYFPNVNKDDNFGKHKPSAYQGYRHINLEFLLYFYQIARHDDDGSKTELLWRLERNFTSVIFDMVEPRKRNRDYSKYLAITFPEDKAIEDFIYENPKNINVFRMQCYLAILLFFRNPIIPLRPKKSGIRFCGFLIF